MKEVEYIKVTNLARLRSISALLRDTLGGEGYGVSKDEVARVYDKVSALADKCSAEISIEEEFIDKITS